MATTVTLETTVDTWLRAYGETDDAARYTWELVGPAGTVAGTD